MEKGYEKWTPRQAGGAARGVSGDRFGFASLLVGRPPRVGTVVVGRDKLAYTALMVDARLLPVEGPASLARRRAVFPVEPANLGRLLALGVARPT